LSHVVHETVPVQVARISRDDAPVVAVMTHGGVPCEFRLVDGALTKSVQCGPGEVVDIESLRGLPDVLDNPIHRSIPAGDLVEVHSSGREGAMVEAFALAEKSGSFGDGTLLRPSPPPCHVIVRRGQGVVSVEADLFSGSRLYVNGLTLCSRDRMYLVDIRVPRSAVVDTLSRCFSKVYCDDDPVEIFDASFVEDGFFDTFNVSAIRDAIMGADNLDMRFPSDVLSNVTGLSHDIGGMEPGTDSWSEGIGSVDDRFARMQEHFAACPASGKLEAKLSFWQDYSRMWAAMRELEMSCRAANDGIGSLVP
jgi:hypothetical protein